MQFKIKNKILSTIISATMVPVVLPGSNFMESQICYAVENITLDKALTEIENLAKKFFTQDYNKIDVAFGFYTSSDFARIMNLTHAILDYAKTNEENFNKCILHNYNILNDVYLDQYVNAKLKERFTNYANGVLASHIKDIKRNYIYIDFEIKKLELGSGYGIYCDPNNKNIYKYKFEESFEQLPLYLPEKFHKIENISEILKENGLCPDIKFKENYDNTMEKIDLEPSLTEFYIYDDNKIKAINRYQAYLLGIEYLNKKLNELNKVNITPQFMDYLASIFKDYDKYANQKGYDELCKKPYAIGDFYENLKLVSPSTYMLYEYSRGQFNGTFFDLFSRYKDNIAKSNNSDIKII